MTLPAKIAWIGPTPTDHGGVSYMSGLLLEGLAELGIEVHAFINDPVDDVPQRLRALPGLTFVCRPSRWKYDQWYSRTALTKFLTGTPASLFARACLAAEAARAHEQHPFDAVYLFNAADITMLRGHLRRLPPVVLHPEVHAAGELRWMIKERHLVGGRTGDRLRFVLFATLMAARAVSQRQGSRVAARLVAPSSTFQRLIVDDYRVEPRRSRIVTNPIDLDRFRPSDRDRPEGPLQVLVVSRLAVRKGIDAVVDLSHRLDDLADQIEIKIIGDRSMWSDYRHLLEDLNPRTSTYLGPLPGQQVADAMRAGDLFLCPSRYEPFGLTVGEALATGMPVVTSVEVGAAEGADPEVVRAYPAGDAAAFESTVRAMVDALRTDRPALRLRARTEAVRLFSPQAMRTQLARALEDL